MYRISAGLKLAALAVGALIASVTGWAGVAICAFIVAAGWVSARLGMASLAHALRPLAIFLLIVFIAQVFFLGVGPAALMIAKIATVVLAATLVSITTKVSDMLTVLENLMNPLRRLGVNPAYVSFLIVLAIRFVPAVFRIGAEVREAQRARGLEGHVIAAAVPLLIRTLREADAVAEALAARGWSP